MFTVKSKSYGRSKLGAFLFALNCFNKMIYSRVIFLRMGINLKKLLSTKSEQKQEYRKPFFILRLFQINIKVKLYLNNKKLLR